jgi:hypothetical protein
VKTGTAASERGNMQAFVAQPFDFSQIADPGTLILYQFYIRVI